MLYHEIFSLFESNLSRYNTINWFNDKNMTLYMNNQSYNFIDVDTWQDICMYYGNDMILYCFVHEIKLH